MAVTTTLTTTKSPPSITNANTNSTTINKRLPPLADKTSLPYKLSTLSKQKLAREATAPDPDIRRCLGHFRLHCLSMEWAQRDMTTRINSVEMEDDSDEEDGPDEEEKKAHARFQVSFEQASTTTPSAPGSADLLDEVTTTTPPAPPEKTDEEGEELDSKTQMQTKSDSQMHSQAGSETEAETEADTETGTETETETEKDSEKETETETETETDTDPESEAEKEKESEGLLEKGRTCIEKTVQRSHFWPSAHGQCIPVRIAG
ncbi:hypothetical protein EYZ11_009584 [Aspergillus tanneri]|uniref:Uncharacterized protein n=1 Tax=Aspergillus tanneri TaxID=1220188 RepID=A0A4S3J7U0_9EURO|nr:uncharacterized protein ATNIH1004_000962 [Aspergillus tanneri]KAA8652061.1 hypothetical protein ATNIH1004_000962 [Aspergillus tanneri]THC90955.1 hypothetical protein EYZ11_009584 [Aspergillus tanneri]